MNWENIISPFFDPITVEDVVIFECIRGWRNRELTATDFTQLPDAPVDKAAWAAYRQELRDLPSQNEDPKLIVFPERP